MAKNSYDMRNYMKLMEADYVGKQSSNPHVTYSTSGEGNTISKVVAKLSSYESGKYTKLAQNLQRMQELAKETDKLKEQVKQDTRDLFNGSDNSLFKAEDAAYTRVIDTVSFVIQLTKDPAPTTNYKYAQILKELETKLTPELKTVLESIKNKYSSVVQKSPALTSDPKPGGVGDTGASESIEEAPVMDKVKDFFKKYLDKVLQWCNNYDRKLAALKSEAGITFESIQSNVSVTEGIVEYNPSTVANLVAAAIHTNKDLSPHHIQLINQPKGGLISVKTSDNSVFEISIKQIQ